MDIPESLVKVLRCPTCGGRLTGSVSGLACSIEREHRFAVKDGFLTFGEPPVGKYDPEYAARYAALWAYGYETLHRGLNESLYRTVSSLVAESLAARPEGAGPPIIVDCGCGVGRSSADCARLAPAGMVLGFDGSLPMLELSERVVCRKSPVAMELADYGFPELTIAGRGADNVFLMRADVERLPMADDSADVALSINVVDRLPGGPGAAFEECHRILRPGGYLVFTDPLNWTDGRLWQRFKNGERLLGVLRDIGFEIECWFDDLSYREILDDRGSFEEFKTLVVQARKRRAGSR